MRREYALVAALLCFPLLFLGGCGSRNGARLVDQGAGWATWSRDSRAVYYIKMFNDRYALHRYNIDTGQRRIWENVQRGQFDISPDESRIAFIRNPTRGRYEICTLNLRTEAIQVVLLYPRHVQGVWWLSDNLLVVGQLFSEKGDCFVVDLTRKIVARVDGGATAIYPANDGPCFMYLGGDDRYYFFDVRHKKRRLLSFGGRKRSNTAFWFPYVSCHKIVYYYNTDIQNIQYPGLAVIDLKTGKSMPVQAPEVDCTGDLSPDMTTLMYSTGLGRGEWSTPKTFVKRLPDEEVRQLRKP